MNSTSPYSMQTAPGPPMGGSGVVVGIDGSSNNLSAVDWAARQAVRSAQSLRVLTVTDKDLVRTPHFSSDLPRDFGFQVYASDIVERVTDNVRHDHPSLQVEADVRVSEPLVGLLDATKDSAVLVVGKRGIGAVKRVLAGSMSIAVSGRSRAPVVVVPDGWHHEDHEREPVLVGVDTAHSDDALLAFAFKAADELEVPLVALHVWQAHPAITHDPEVLARWGQEARVAVEALLEPWRVRFPHVDALAAQERAHPADGLLDAAERSQLLVLGRKSSGSSPMGLGFVSLARGILHASTRPVAVVPTKDAA